MAEYFGGVHGSYPGVEGLPAKCLPVGKFPLDLIRLRGQAVVLGSLLL